MRVAGLAVLAAWVGGCTSVKLVQRDGCWVRRTERWPKQVREEVGPCVRPPPTWVADRHTRLVQECVAEADYRWQTRALAAWNRGEPLPKQEPEEKVLQTCMKEAATAMVTENEALTHRLNDVTNRLAELTKEREELRASMDDDRAKTRASFDRMASDLGDAAKEAAKKTAAPAVATATATSDGRATTESGSSMQTSPVASVGTSAPGSSGAVEPSRSAPAADAKSPTVRRARAHSREKRVAKRSECTPPSTREQRAGDEPCPPASGAVTDGAASARPKSPAPALPVRADTASPEGP